MVYEENRRTIFESQKAEIDGHTVYLILAPGIHFQYFVSPDTKSFIHRDKFLSEDGNLTLVMDKKYELTTFKKLVEKILLVEDNKLSEE